MRSLNNKGGTEKEREDRTHGEIKFGLTENYYNAEDIKLLLVVVVAIAVEAAVVVIKNESN